MTVKQCHIYMAKSSLYTLKMQVSLVRVFYLSSNLIDMLLAPVLLKVFNLLGIRTQMFDKKYFYRYSPTCLINSIIHEQ